MKRFNWKNKHKLAAVIASSVTCSQVLRTLGLSSHGNNFRTFKRWRELHGLDISHFVDKIHFAKQIRQANHRKEIEILCENSTVDQRTLRRYVKDNEVLLFSCVLCDNNGVWQGKRLTLQLDHRNGVKNDNRPENLRWLCPNCHSQTETFGSKNLRR